MSSLRVAFAVLTIGTFAAPAVAAEDAVALCTRLAAHAYDPDYKGPRAAAVIDIDIAAAEPACRQAVKDRPADRHINFMLGRVLRQKEDMPAAIAQLNIAADMGSTAAMTALGTIYETAENKTPQDFAKAATYYKRAIDGGNGWGATGLGTLYEYGWGVTKDPVEAERLFRLAITTNSLDIIPEAKNNIAWMLANAGTRLAEAETLAKEAVAGIGDKDEWSKASYLDTLALVRHKLGRDAEAVLDSEASIKLISDVPGYHDRLGDIYLALGRKADAKKAWEKALALDPPGPADDPEFSIEATKAKLAKLG